MSTRREFDEHDDFRAFEAQFDRSADRSYEEEFAALDALGTRDPLDAANRRASGRIPDGTDTAATTDDATTDDATTDDVEDEFGPELFDDLDELGYRPVPRSRAVRWTAILVVASFALGGLFSVLRFL